MCDARKKNESTSSNSNENSCTTCIKVKWGTEIHDIDDISNDTTIRQLKRKIHRKIGIKPERQKMLNLCKGRLPDDNQTIGQLGIKPGFKLIVMGSKEEDILKSVYNVPNCERPLQNIPIIKRSTQNSNQPDIPNREQLRGIENPIDYEIYFGKLQKKMRTHKVKALNKMDPEKKLLILGINDPIDIKMNRQSVHNFLHQMYKYYNIVLWSNSDSPYARAVLVSMSFSQKYKISIYLDRNNMINMFEPSYGIFKIKPLDIIWMNFPDYSERNTIVIEDKWKYIYLNDDVALIIRKLANVESHENDVLLERIGEYLRLIGELEDLRMVDHRNWDEYRKKEIKNRLSAILGPLPDERQIVKFLAGSERLAKYHSNLNNDESSNRSVKRIKLDNHEGFYDEVERKFEEYPIRELQPLKTTKKLLILDLDYALFNPEKKMPRPHLYQFLDKVGTYYNIGIWSAANRSWVHDVLSSWDLRPDGRSYRIGFYLDGSAMIPVEASKKIGQINVKPLALIWRRFTYFSPRNTIAVDVDRAHFLMNQQSGLEILPFHPTDDEVDDELKVLCEYLTRIAKCDDFTSLDHKYWKRNKSETTND